MKNILFLISISFIIVSCSGCSDTPQANLPVPKNYVILLDLSDRLLRPNQLIHDQEIIKTVFETFTQTVRRGNMIVNSRDKFRVVIAPQKGANYDSEEFMTQLFIDMEQISIAQKRKKLEDFEARWVNTLSELYQQATQNKNKHEDFAGCDLWKYFNEQLETDLLKNYDNQLIILTDGYFDFESNPNTKHSANRSTATNFIPMLRQSTDWKKIIEQKDCGLIAIQKSYPPTSVIVSEISPKNNNLDESEILTAVWNKWLSEMGLDKVNLELSSNVSKTRVRIKGILQ